MNQDRDLGQHTNPDITTSYPTPENTGEQQKSSLVNRPFTREAIVEDLNLDTTHDDTTRALDSFMAFAEGAPVKRHLFSIAQRHLHPFRRPKPGENKNGLNPLESTT